MQTSNGKNSMSRYIERRAGPRTVYKSPAKLKDLKTGKFSNARIVNFCDKGLYLESNSQFDTGAEVILGIENSPYTRSSHVMDVYRAKIVWCKQVDSTFYNYGYGALLKQESNENMDNSALVDNSKMTMA
jgi:hypothetical protein